MAFMVPLFGLNCNAHVYSLRSARRLVPGERPRGVTGYRSIYWQSGGNRCLQPAVLSLSATWVWFAVVGLAGVPLIASWNSPICRRNILAIVFLVCTVCPAAIPDDPERNDVWSPYQKLTLRPATPERRALIRYALTTNDSCTRPSSISRRSLSVAFRRVPAATAGLPQRVQFAVLFLPVGLRAHWSSAPAWETMWQPRFRTAAGSVQAVRNRSADS